MEEYNGKTIIAWLTYNENYTGEDNRVLYVFPRYVKLPKGAKNLFEKMPDESANDRIDIYLPPGKDAPEEYANYGPLVEVKFNEEPKLSSKNIGDRNFFTVLFSMIEIEKFHEMMFQVVDASSNFNDISINKFIEYPASQIFTNELIIGTNDYAYYGPFEAVQEGEKVLLSGKKQYHYFIKKYSVFEINQLCIPIIDDKGKPQALFIQRHELPIHEEDPQNRIDWMGDEELSEKLKSILKTVESPQRYTKRDIREISAAISKALEINTDVDLTEERNKRILGIFDMMLRHEDFIENIFSYLMNNSEMFDLLIALLQEDDFKKIEAKNSAFSKVRQRLAALESEKEGIKKKIEKLNESEKETRVKIQQLKDMEQQLQDVIVQSLTEFSNKEKTIVKAIDAVWLNRIFQTQDYEPKEVQEEEYEESNPVFDVQLLVRPERASGNAIIERISEYIKSTNRDISRNDVVNYLTCIMQGFITTFAGEPGTGKTSLCTILAKSLGLARSDTNSRFIDISVERGWTSHKDFIGYYNPLTKNIEKSNNEVFDAFARLDQECTQPADALFFILLDEANLSPIEHYWAAFLKLCDPDSPHSRSLVLGGNHFLKIPEHLRFLATVNFDHTTEELSPRFLDRSWIITLNPTNINSTLLADYEIANLESIIPFSSLNTAFLPRSETVGNSDPIAVKCHEKWDSIQQIFQKNNLSIMPRNQKMVRSYYTVACRYMERDENRFIPLDYAVAQKILPIINGTGKHYQSLLTELRETCRMMPLCDYHIGRILKAADENMGFYQFFAK